MVLCVCWAWMCYSGRGVQCGRWVCTWACGEREMPTGSSMGGENLRRGEIRASCPSRISNCSSFSFFLFLCSSLCSFFSKNRSEFLFCFGIRFINRFPFFFNFLVCQFYSLFFMGYLRIVHTFSKRVNKNTGK